jgi:ferredoxin
MMRKTCNVTLNKETFFASCGDLLLDGAMMNGIDLPHDCRSGICGTCRVRLVDGKVFGGTEHGSDMIYACQARLVSDIEVVTQPVPDPVAVSARVANLTRLAPDVIGVDVEVPKALDYLAGQYAKCGFAVFPHGAAAPPIR